MNNKQDMLQLFTTLAAIASFCLGVGGLLMHVRLGQVAGQPVFVSPYFSAVVIFCGLALYAARTYPRYSRFWAIIAILAIIFAHTAQLVSESWVNGRDISAYFATGLVLLGAIGGLLFHHVFQPPRHLASRKDFAIAVSGVAISTFVSFALIDENIAAHQHVATTSANSIASDLKRNTAEGTALAIRMSERFSTLEPMPSETFFLTEFRRYLNYFPFFTGLALVDSDGLIVHQASREDFLAKMPSLTDHSEMNGLLHQARTSTLPRTALLQMPCCNPKTEVVVAPMFGPILNNWSVIAFIDLVDIVRWSMDQTTHGGYFRVKHQDDVLYQTAGEKPANMVAAGTLHVSNRGNTWLQLSYLYTTSDVAFDTEVWADFVWLAGLIFTFLLISSQRMTELASKHSVQLSHNALHDPLTGLPNRRILEKALQEASKRAKRHSKLISVIFFDVEGVKLINDSIGHDTGDRTLIEVARRLTQTSPEGSAVTQLSGTEFVLVLTGVSLQQAQEHTQNIITELSSPYNIDGRTVRMAVCAGIVSSSDHTNDPMELVRQADLAMLEAKKEGHNTWRTYTEDLSILGAERLELRNDLQTALETNSLELYYHPIVEGLSGRVIGVEALTRWLHETRGYVPPDRFIALAEEFGQIGPLTNWALYTACRDSGRLRELGLPAFPVIVNISPLYFQRSDFIDNVQQALRQTNLAAEFLELEITEGVLLDDKKASVQKLNQLQSMGIRISIDDFGTGYSSLSYLKKLPIDKIKIDRSFITDLVNDPADAAITQAIISMAHHLNLRVVAEGVETIPQLAFLRRRNCDAFQGYLFAKPMPFAQLVPLLLKSRGHLFPSRSPSDQGKA